MSSTDCGEISLQMHVNVWPHLPKLLSSSGGEELMVTLVFIFYSPKKSWCGGNLPGSCVLSAMRRSFLQKTKKKRKKFHGFVPCSLHHPWIFWEAMCTAADRRCMIQYMDIFNPFHPYVVGLQHETIYCPHNLFRSVYSGWQMHCTGEITLT